MCLSFFFAFAACRILAIDGATNSMRRSRAAALTAGCRPLCAWHTLVPLTGQFGHRSPFAFAAAHCVDLPLVGGCPANVAAMSISIRLVHVAAAHVGSLQQVAPIQWDGPWRDLEALYERPQTSLEIAVALG